MLKRVLIVSAIIVVVLLVIVGAGYYVLLPQLMPPPVVFVPTPSRTPEATPTPPPTATPDDPAPVSKPTPSPVPSPEPAPSPTPSPGPGPTPTPVVAGPTPTPQPQKVTIELTEEQVNAKLKELMVQYKDKLPLQAENPVIRLHPGKVEAQAVALGITVWGEGRIEIQDGKPKIVVDILRTGGPNGPPLLPAIAQLITSRIPSADMLPVGIPMEVTSVTILEGKVIIEGIPK